MIGMIDDYRDDYRDDYDRDITDYRDHDGIIRIIADFNRDYYGITPLKSNMDAEKSTILEAGATF